MPLIVYNTRTGQKEEFEPRTPGKIGIYVCGLTVYDYTHIGHARTYIAFDMIVRYLRYLGYQVTYVQNVTDVDDKMIKRAKEMNTTVPELGRKYTRLAFEDMDRLAIRRADLFPKATEHIEDMIAMIKTLVDKGYAYVSGGDVYLSVDNAKDYGKLSHQKLEELKAGARVEVGQQKKNPLDFTLWKAYKPGEISWPSPWGEGRPGWHIECSAMSTKYLGPGFDIHGGARDLIFPHHENEIAQAELATGVAPFVTYWLHVGFLNIHGQKMSKSLGNFITVRDLLKTYEPEALRFLVLQYHYRTPIDFSYEKLQEAQRTVQRIQTTLERIRSLASQITTVHSFNKRDNKMAESIKNTNSQFHAALDDDFNTPVAFAAILDLVGKIDDYLREGKANPDVLEQILLLFDKMNDILGVFHSKQEVASGLTSQLLDLLIEIRNKARESKNWETSDFIRDQLDNLDIILEDFPEGTRWKLKSKK